MTNLDLKLKLLVLRLIINMSHLFKLRHRKKFVAKFSLNRYRRRLETCQQAKTSKSGHAIFFYFFRRVRATSMTQRRVESTCVHLWTFSPVSVKIEISIYLRCIVHQGDYWVLCELYRRLIYLRCRRWLFPTHTLPLTLYSTKTKFCWGHPMLQLLY